MRVPRFPVVLSIWCGLSLPAFAVDPTGIPECDTFLQKYETCGLDILTGGQKISFEKSIIDSSMSFRASADNPDARAALVRLCTDTMNALKTNETPFKICMNQ